MSRKTSVRSYERRDGTKVSQHERSLNGDAPKTNSETYQPPKLERLSKGDYEEPNMHGAKMVNWSGLSKREKNLYRLQRIHRPKVIDRLELLGYEVLEVERRDDGWMTGFDVDFFTVRDKRAGEVFELKGNDDNTALFKNHSRWLEIPGTHRWSEVESQMPLDDPSQYAGFIASNKNNTVAIYDAKAQGLDGGKYVVSCELHNEMVAVNSLKAARSALQSPEDFCSKHRGES